MFYSRSVPSAYYKPPSRTGDALGAAGKCTVVKQDINFWSRIGNCIYSCRSPGKDCLLTQSKHQNKCDHSAKKKESCTIKRGTHDGVWQENFKLRQRMSQIQMPYEIFMYTACLQHLMITMTAGSVSQSIHGMNGNKKNSVSFPLLHVQLICVASPFLLSHLTEFRKSFLLFASPSLCSQKAVFSSPSL